MKKIRNPVYAGQFYPGSKASLQNEVKSFLTADAKIVDAIGVISPHAGYIYSGHVAGSVLSSIKPKPVYVIMGPNHTGNGAPFSISGSDSWKTPMGEAKINSKLSECIKSTSRYIKEDSLAHESEHSIEVQLPFLQVLQKKFTFVPIVISYANIAVYRQIGNELAAAIRLMKLEKDVVIIASSDMTHYEDDAAARAKDKLAIEAITALDAEKLVGSIERFDISMCGYAPTAVMLTAAKELGASAGRLVKYATSGDASGDYSSVVGYAGIVVT